MDFTTREVQKEDGTVEKRFDVLDLTEDEAEAFALALMLAAGTLG